MSEGRDRRREVESILVLDALPGVGPAAVRKLVEAAGSSARALASPKLLAAVAGPQAAAAANDGEIRERVRAGLAEADRLGMGVVVAGDPEYPARLRHLVDPPSVLFLRGEVALLRLPGVAVVGSRRSTQRARDAARRIARAVARLGVPVVSGLALGVDGAAHEGALDVAGPTVAVLGTGAERAYPVRHASLFRRIVEEGLVVTEFLPGTPPLPHHFPRRNRILAALADVVVVAEAAERSGALITAEHALDLGREIWAVPGPFGEAFCAGSNALLADGARPLVTVNGFIRLALGVEPGEPGVSTDLTGPEVRLLEVLAGETRSADEVARSLGMEPREALTMLASMELRGAVTRLAGMRFRRAG